MKPARLLISLVAAIVWLGGTAWAQTSTPTETPALATPSPTATPTIPPTPTGATVSGTIQYSGWIDGTHVAHVEIDTGGTPTPLWTASVSKADLSPPSGTIWSATLPNGSYSFRAYWDADGSGAFDNCDPSAILTPFLIEGVARTDANFGLADPCTPTISPTPTITPTSSSTPTVTPTPTITPTPLPWPMFHYNSRHIGLSPYEGPLLPQLDWSYAAGMEVSSSAAISATGSVYIGSDDNNLYSLNSNGTLQWSYAAGAAVSSSPAITSDGMVYVGSQGNALYALDSAAGAAHWSYVTGGQISSSPSLGTDGSVYFGSYDSRLYALAVGGSLMWSYATADEVYSSPAVGTDGRVSFGSRDDRVYELNSNGALRWSYATGAAVSSSPAVGTDGSVCIGSDDLFLYRINSNGALAWSFRTAGNVRTCPAIGSDGSIYFSAFQTVYALNSNGALRGTFTAGGDVLSSPVLDPLGRVYVGSDDGRFYILEAATGSLLWSYATGGAVESSPAISSDGRVYFGSGDHTVYAVNSAPTPTPTPTGTPTPFVHYVELEVLPNQGRTIYHPGDKIALAWRVYIDDYDYSGVPVDIYVAARIRPPCTPVPTPDTGGSTSCAVTVEEISASSGWLYVFNNKLQPELVVAGTTPPKTFENVSFPLEGGIVLGSLVFTVPKIGDTLEWGFATAFVNKNTNDWVAQPEVIVSNTFTLMP